MDLQINLVPAEEMTQAELVALTATLRTALGRRADVEAVQPVHQPAPDGAKGWLTAAGTLLVSTPVVSGVIDTVKAVLTRPGAPPVTVKFTKDGFEGSFDPRTVTPEQFTTMVTALSATLPA